MRQTLFLTGTLARISGPSPHSVRNRGLTRRHCSREISCSGTERLRQYFTATFEDVNPSASSFTRSDSALSSAEQAPSVKKGGVTTSQAAINRATAFHMIHPIYVLRRIFRLQVSTSHGTFKRTEGNAKTADGVGRSRYFFVLIYRDFFECPNLLTLNSAPVAAVAGPPKASWSCRNGVGRRGPGRDQDAGGRVSAQSRSRAASIWET